MAKAIKAIAWISAGLTLLCIGAYLHVQTQLFFVLAITFGTTAYHFLMRLLVGWIINGILHNRVDYTARWFRVKPWEQKLYKVLRVKSWKNKMPTFEPEFFDRKRHGWEQILQAMCQAELVHEVIIVLSFAPILLAIPFGEIWVFVITSVLAACVDGAFVMMQRFNRPRVMQLLQKQTKKV